MRFPRKSCVMPLVAALLAMSPPAGATELIPAGSYIETCGDVRYDPASQMLTASCQRQSGTTPRDTRLNVANCADRSIWNQNGDLYCLAAAPWGDERVIPKGSYIDSCTGIGVTANTLSAICWRGTSRQLTAEPGSQVEARLDLNACDWAGDISNDYGTLRCAPRVIRLAPVAPAPPRITMVPVEPNALPVQASGAPAQLDTLGVVPDKPPVPDAAPPGAAPADGKPARAKHKRNRGERG